MSIEIMTVSAIKAQVIRVEGFDLQVEGKRKLAASLHHKKQSDDEMTVSAWINENFPGVEKGVVSILNGKGQLAKRGDTLIKVRASYPSNFKLLAKQKNKVEKRAANTTTKLKEKNKTIRQAKGDLKKTVQQTALKINTAQRNAELGAAYDAVDKALRKPNTYHERVRELCKTATSSEGLHDTQALVERILAAWSHAEKEKDHLNKYELKSERGNLPYSRQPSSIK